MGKRNEKATRTRVAVAMSGGVDSTVTAALLKEKGYDVQGVFMALAQPDLRAQVEQVEKVAERIGVPLEVIDLSITFQEKVIRYFVEGYYCGTTPNPCMYCNPRIKFGALLDRVVDSVDYLATGHYARIVDGPEGPGLFRGMDRNKDQSYFLSQLTREKLTKILFPLGELKKDEVYQMAEGYGFSGFQKGGESQDVCFLKETGVKDFLENHRKDRQNQGMVVTREGKEVGRHDGIHLYTVGQRRGLGIPDQRPYYVISLDFENNAVIVGRDEDLRHQGLILERMNWISGSPPKLPGEFVVMIRYRHDGATAEVDQDAQGRIIIRFHEVQRAVTPGQFGVLYHNDEVVGGGEICAALHD